MVSARARRLVGMVLTSHRDGAKAKRSVGALPAHHPPAGAAGNKSRPPQLAASFMTDLCWYQPLPRSHNRTKVESAFAPSPGSLIPFEFRSGPFCQGHRSPASSVDPNRIVCPCQFASPRLAVFPRRTACRSRTAYRFQHAAPYQASLCCPS